MALPSQNDIKHVFICGLHRSGTTVLAQRIGKFKDCTGFEGTGAIMDEGQFLQDVYPPLVAHGGVGKFGFAPESHLTENSPLLTPTNIARLRQCWEAHWDGSRAVRIEKTPGNLVMSRFLQAAFPNAHFIVIKRHPVAVSLASQKWSRSPIHELFEHWLRCYERFEADKRYLAHVYELSYEDYIENPPRYLKQIADFIGVEFSSSCQEEAAAEYNKKYFAQWDQLLGTSGCGSYYRYIARLYDGRFAKYGYCLVSPSTETNDPLGKRTVIDSVVGPLLRVAWDLYAVVWRADLQLRIAVQRLAHRYLPGKIRRVVRDAQASIVRHNLWKRAED